MGLGCVALRVCLIGCGLRVYRLTRLLRVPVESYDNFVNYFHSHNFIA